MHEQLDHDVTKKFTYLCQGRVSHVMHGAHVQATRLIWVSMALGTIHKISMSELLLTQHKSRSVFF